VPEPHRAEEAAVTEETEETGNAQVDQVLAGLEVLSDLPVEEHVAVFEAAHAGLRDALR
jgi:hypothetical protein